MHTRVRVISDMDCYPFLGPVSICVYNCSYIYVLVSHKRQLVQMDLSTVETDVSSWALTLLRLKDGAAGQTMAVYMNYLL